MNLDCLNDIITDDLAIHIDLTNTKSWDLNSGLTSYSLTKWSGAYSGNLDLKDFGLTGFDNGRTNEMWGGLKLKPEDNLFSMYRVGYNVVQNPTTGETSGVTVNTQYLPMSGITTGASGNYFELAGGYLQGFFKLDGYDYELLPSRYNRGVTIETLIYLNPDSKGIFYTMGTRAEDKYNQYFSGETQIDGSDVYGVVTSEDNHLDSIKENVVMKTAFREYENSTETEYTEIPQSANTKNNIIAFEITEDKKIAYKYIDENNNIISDSSIRSINPTTGWTMIAISFIPNNVVGEKILECAPRREGKFIIFVNGRPLWILDDYPEFFFKAFNNDKEKQVGVPYSISWGGGSFGLKHSWHYNTQTYGLYDGKDQSYIDMNFIVESDPFPEECNPYSGGTILSGLTLSADSTTFYNVDNCDPNIDHPITVMRVENISGATGNTYFIKYNNPITVLSNRDYEIDLKLYVDDFFKTYNIDDNLVQNNVSVLVYGSEDVDIIEETEFKYPLTSDDLTKFENTIYEGEYTYVKDGVKYFGATGLPVYTDPDYYLYYGSNFPTNEEVNNSVITGLNKWLPMKTKFRVKDNTGKQIVYVGILIKTSDSFNVNSPLFITDFTYSGADVLVQDPRKDNLLIQQNFDSSFNGAIQKLRVYNKGLTSQEILHNALIEKNKNPYLGLEISKGGRIIYR